MKSRKILAKFLLVIFLVFLFSDFNILESSDLKSYKKYGLPLIGVSIVAGFGANYLRKEALKRYDEAEKLWNEYMSIPSGASYEEFEEAYEKYEDKYGEALKYRNYYLICGGVAILSGAAGFYLILYSSSNKIISIGYNSGFYNNRIYLRVKF
jgi:hypothetical protein